MDGRDVDLFEGFESHLEDGTTKRSDSDSERKERKRESEMEVSSSRTRPRPSTQTGKTFADESLLTPNT